MKLGGGAREHPHPGHQGEAMGMTNSKFGSTNRPDQQTTEEIEQVRDYVTRKLVGFNLRDTIQSFKRDIPGTSCERNSQIITGK